MICHTTAPYPCLWRWIPCQACRRDVDGQHRAGRRTGPATGSAGRNDTPERHRLTTSSAKTQPLWLHTGLGIACPLWHLFSWSTGRRQQGFALWCRSFGQSKGSRQTPLESSGPLRGTIFFGYSRCILVIDPSWSINASYFNQYLSPEAKKSDGWRLICLVKTCSTCFCNRSLSVQDLICG